MQVIPAGLKGFDFEAIVMNGTAATFTPAKIAKAKSVMIQFQGADGYYRLDGTPTAAAGGGVFSADGDAPTFLDRFDFTNFEAIAASGFLVVQYLA